jgi:hypothetical protein
MRGQLQHPREIVLAGDGRFGDDQHLGGAAQRSDDRTADAGGAVDDHQIALLFLGDAPGLLAHGGDQLARILGGHPQPGMDHRPATGIGNHPFAAEPLGKIDGLFRAETHTDPAALAGHRIDDAARTGFGFMGPHRVEPAEVAANSAAGAVRLADDRLVPAAKIVTLPDIRLQHQMQIGRVDVAIGEHRLFSQHGERGGDAGLAGPPLAADNDQLFHSSTFSFSEMEAEQNSVTRIVKAAMAFISASSPLFSALAARGKRAFRR